MALDDQVRAVDIHMEHFGSVESRRAWAECRAKLLASGQPPTNNARGAICSECGKLVHSWVVVGDKSYGVDCGCCKLSPVA